MIENNHSKSSKIPDCYTESSIRIIFLLIFKNFFKFRFLKFSIKHNLEIMELVTKVSKFANADNS